MPISAPPPKHSPRQKYIPSPDAAGLLSFLFPGLGQIWSGEKRKGALFMLAHLINLSALLTIVCAPFILSSLVSFGESHHMRLNIELRHSFADLGPGSPTSLILILLLLSFAMFAARDAFDHNALKRRQAIHHDYVLAMPEATSGSYIFHVSFLLACLVLAFFFLIPPAPHSQVTVIEFRQNEENTKEKVVSNKRAEHSSKAAGHHDPRKESETAASKSQTEAGASRQKSQTRNSKVEEHAAAQKQTQSKAETPVKAAEPPAPAVPLLHPVPHPIPHPMPPVRAVTGPVPTPTAPPRPTVPAPAINAMTPTATVPHPQTPLLPPPAVIAQSRFAPAPVAVNKIAMGTPGPLLPASVVKASSFTGGGPPTPVHISTARPGTEGGVGTDSNPTPVPVSARGTNGTSGNKSGPDGTANAPSPRKSDGISSSVPGGGPGSRLMAAPLLNGNHSGTPGNKGSATNTNPDHGPRDGNSEEAAADINWGPYMSDLQRRIKRCWYPPSNHETKRVKVIFSLTRNGELTNLRIIRSSGLNMADNAALKAVENAAPFRPLPAGAPSTVDIEFTFDYNVFGGAGAR